MASMITGAYLPLVASLTFDDEARQYLVAAILRPGNAAGTAGAVGLLKRLLPETLARLSPRPAPRAAGWGLRYAGDF